MVEPVTVERTAAVVRDVELQEFLEQIEAVRRDARTLTDGLSDAQLNWRPAPTRWSVAQCLQHLTLTLQLYPQKLNDAIAEAHVRSRRGDRAYREGPFTRWFIRSMEPPAKMRVRTIAKVDPPKELAGDVVRSAFDAELTRFAALVAAADGASLGHGRASSPFFSLLRFTLRQVIAVNVAHLRRHLWQARQVQQHAAFPSA